MLRKTKIVCSIGRIADTELSSTIKNFICKGMDVARINMAHYDLENSADRQYLERLISTIREVAANLKIPVAILGDIQGPKVRIKEFLGSVQRVNENKICLEKDTEFILTSKSVIPSSQQGASIKHGGNFKFFKDIRATIKNRTRPVEFWFGDGKVILEALLKDINDTSATCRVKVAGELKEGQGVSVKNATIRPRTYSLSNYPKDRTDIEFLIENDVDLLALSFVNHKDDVRNLEEHIKTKIEEKGLRDIQERFYGMEVFPIISKIETEEGIKRLDEILEVSYGIMVARGDLALQTGIQTIGINQKEIIDKCVTNGKPVITATQMLLSMMDFIEPRRSEATDVTNAIFDGTDALMLSEETADPSSKFPFESIQMMADISTVTEEKIKERAALEYRYKIDQRHEKTLVNLKESMIEEEQGELQKVEDTEHICYDACKTAFELKCKAIIVLTDTGGTARMVSKLKPDVPILAGVYEDRIARILKISYGVETFKITRNDTGYPFGEFQEVIEQAKGKGLIEDGDRVILVAGYPRGEPGTTTFLDIYRVSSKEK